MSSQEQRDFLPCGCTRKYGTYANFTSAAVADDEAVCPNERRDLLGQTTCALSDPTEISLARDLLHHHFLSGDLNSLFWSCGCIAWRHASLR